METPIKLTACEFINPWGQAMPAIYTVTLMVEDDAVDAASTADLWTLVNALNTDAYWQRCWEAAESQTDGTISLEEGRIIATRYLVKKPDYPRFKTALKRIKTEL